MFYPLHPREAIYAAYPTSIRRGRCTSRNFIQFMYSTPDAVHFGLEYAPDDPQAAYSWAVMRCYHHKAHALRVAKMKELRGGTLRVEFLSPITAQALSANREFPNGTNPRKNDGSHSCG